MDAKTTLLIASLLLLGVASPALAQSNDPNASGPGAMHGQDSEFGRVRTPYTATMDGARTPVEAHVWLNHNYEEQQSRFFMFAWTVEQTPLLVSFESLKRADTGQELPCYQRQGDEKSQIKCFVDLKDMPPAGTEIVMKGTLGSTKVGSFQVGAIVVPFTYSWLRVRTSNGLDAELYGYTMVNVNKATGGSGRLGGLGNAVPGVGAVGAIGAVAVVAVGLAALRRSR